MSRSQLDAAILAMPAEQRQAEDAYTLPWFQALLRRLVSEQLLRADAQGWSRAESELGPQLREQRSQVLAQAYVAKHLPRPDQPTEASLRAIYERDRARFQRPETRLTYHLFLRRKNAASGTGQQPGSNEDLVREAAALRSRVLAGERFADLAAQRSDSESRHQDGLLGWVRWDELPEPLADVIFALEPEVPSQPQRANEGVHLFQVEEVRQGHDFQYEEVKGPLLRRFMQERFEQALESLAKELDPPPGTYVASLEDLERLLEAGQPDAPVLRVVDYTLSVAAFAAALEGSLTLEGEQDRQQRAQQLLDSLLRRELIYQQALREGLDQEPKVAATLAAGRDQVLARRVAEQALRQHLRQQDQVLRDFYQQHQRRFSSPLRLDVELFSLPVENPEEGNRVMALLEERRRSDGLDLHSMATELGGKVEQSGLATLGQLAALGKASTFAQDLKTDETSAPFWAGATVQMVRVLQREEPRELAFDEAYKAVLSGYLRRHGDAAVETWRKALTQSAGLQVMEERLPLR